MSRKVYVIGVGMTKFEKPGSKAWDYPDMAKEAGTKALDDAGIPYSEVEQAVVGYVYGESTCGQRAVYQLGLTGIPVYNVNNNCSTGSTALFMGKQLVEGGLADCVLALGFEKMQKGSLGATFTDRINPMDQHVNAMVAAPRVRAASAGRAALRQRRPRAHGEVRHDADAVRQDRLQEPQALGQQPVLAVPGRVLARGHPRRADGLRAAHQAPVLPDVRRLRRRRPRQRGLRQEAQPPGQGGRDRRPGDGHRHRRDVRQQEQHQAHRQRHDAPRGATASTSRPASARRTSTSSSSTTASPPTR